jgi:signal transduction histidine kinase
MIVPWDVLLLGFATILDSVLLIILFERVNASQVGVWLRILVGATLVSHASSFVRSLSLSSNEMELHSLDRVCYALTATGLLILPSAMLHAAVRLNHTGTQARPQRDARYVLLYAPALLVPWVVGQAINGIEAGFLSLFQPMVIPFLVWMGIANTLSIVLFLKARRGFESRDVKSFFSWHCLLLVVITLLAFVYVFVGVDSDRESSLRLATILSPLAPLLLFVWYSLRMRLLPLVMERTLVYGAVFLALFLCFRFVIAPVVQAWNARSELDLFSLGVGVSVLLILLWRPLRKRVLESLRYLLSNNVFQVRDATRRLSVQLSKLGTLPPEELIEQFQSAIAQSIDLQHCRIHIESPGGTEKKFSAGSNDGVETRSGERMTALAILKSAIAVDEDGILARDWGVSSEVASAMEALDVMWAFRLSSGMVQGMVLLGPRWRSDRLADEQRTALLMLFEQLAVTLENRYLDIQRLRAERFATQQDKLSTLGLMASTWAHEIRNPLSSIKTLTTLAMEDANSSEHGVGDLQMILSEIDRMSVTTQRLLEFARPIPSTGGTNKDQVCVPDKTLERLLFVLQHLAQQSHVLLTAELHAPHVSVHGSDAEVGEIFFNLIKNAIEALSPNQRGTVRVGSEFDDHFLHVTISDDGPGIASSIRENLFHPFITGKQSGNGLGLYVASERAKEIGGRVVCESEPGQGTIFRVSLPIWREVDMLGVRHS